METMMVTIIFIDDVDFDSENDDMTRLIFMMTMNMMFYILLMRMLLMIKMILLLMIMIAKLLTRSRPLDVLDPFHCEPA